MNLNYEFKLALSSMIPFFQDWWIGYNSVLFCFCFFLYFFPQAFSILTDAQKDDIKKRRILLSLYIEAEELVIKLDPKIRAVLQQSVGNLEEKIENHKLQLKRKEYFVLVAGQNHLS